MAQALFDMVMRPCKKDGCENQYDGACISSRATVNNDLMTRTIGVLSWKPSVVPKSVIYTSERDGEHSRPVDMGVVPPRLQQKVNIGTQCTQSQ